MNRVLVTGLVIVACCARLTTAQNVGLSANDEAAIRTTGEAYVEAFNQGDPQALAEFWSPDAVYVNRVSGEQVIGRRAIAEQFTQLFESVKDLKLEIQVEAIQFVSPNVAIEDGQATFLSAGAEPDQVAYSAVYVRRDGRWLLDRVTDNPEAAASSHYEKLKELEWMVGSWVDESEDAVVETVCEWTRNRNFLTRSFKVSAEGMDSFEGTQVIGWDPAAERIRSWLFDSDGGFAQGVWRRDGNRWIARTRQVLPDGQLASSVNVFTLVDADTFTWQSTERVVAGSKLPDVEEFPVVRVASKK